MLVELIVMIIGIWGGVLLGAYIYRLGEEKGKRDKPLEDCTEKYRKVENEQPVGVVYYDEEKERELQERIKRQREAQEELKKVLGR